MATTRLDLWRAQVDNLRATLTNLYELTEGEPFGDAGSMSEHLKAAEDGLRSIRHRIESSASERICPTCDGPVVGRKDRVYCSTPCRVEHHRGTSARVVQRRAVGRPQ